MCTPSAASWTLHTDHGYVLPAAMNHTLDFIAGVVTPELREVHPQHIAVARAVERIERGTTARLRYNPGDLFVGVIVSLVIADHRNLPPPWCQWWCQWWCQRGRC